MIVSIEGKIVESAPLKAIIDIQGIGYEVHMPITTTEKLPSINSSVKLHTLVVYREDAHTLYGFFTKDERDFFRLLVEKVSGIGPKIALSILSRLSIPILKQAISQGNTQLLAQCPGIGKKTAERLIVELKDKVGLVSPAEGKPLSQKDGYIVSDAVSALIALGYKAPEADKMVRQSIHVLGENVTLEAVIKKALSF